MKAKWGALMTDGSGKIGGHVAAKNRGGSYLRTKRTPLNPKTSAQSLARSILATLSSMWRELTDAERQSFNDSVTDYASTDVFGDIRNPSGINLFVKLNANLLASGQAIVTLAPVKVEIPFAEVTAVVIDTTAGTITATTVGAAFATAVVKVQATPNQSAGVSFVKSQLRNIGYRSITGNNPALYTDYIAKFGVPPVNGNVYLTFAAIPATGQQGVAQKIKATIV